MTGNLIYMYLTEFCFFFFIFLVHMNMIIWVFFMYSSSYCHELLIIHITQTLALGGVYMYVFLKLWLQLTSETNYLLYGNPCSMVINIKQMVQEIRG